MPKFLLLESVLVLHEQGLADYGGAQGVRDQGLLESALAQPEAMFGGAFLHRDLFEMAAAYLFHIVMNHPFVDGNKRTGLDAATTFLNVNGVRINAPDAELYQLVIDVTQSVCKKPEIAEFFRTHAVSGK